MRSSAPVVAPASSVSARPRRRAASDRLDASRGAPGRGYPEHALGHQATQRSGAGQRRLRTKIPVPESRRTRAPRTIRMIRSRRHHRRMKPLLSPDIADPQAVRSERGTTKMQVERAIPGGTVRSTAVYGEGGGIRTHGHNIKNVVLYQAELHPPRVGFHVSTARARTQTWDRGRRRRVVSASCRRGKTSFTKKARRHKGRRRALPVFVAGNGRSNSLDPVAS